MGIESIDRKESLPTYEGKLDHLLESYIGSVFCLHARAKPLGSLGRQIDRTVVVVVVSFVVSAKVDAELVDVAVVVGFTFVSSCERHVAEQIPSHRFLLKEEEVRVEQKLQQLSRFLGRSL